MKIAIMTQPLGHNYGGIMQAWALQRVLKRLGHDPVTIDRRHEPKGIAYSIARSGYRAIKRIVGETSIPNIEGQLPIILQHPRKFVEQHVVTSEPLNTTSKLRAHFAREQYEAVIVGSDQTWRPRYSPNIDNYFLDFLEFSDIKRIAYASSFGVDEWEFTEQQALRCSALAKQFDVISVREDTGVQLCRRHLGVRAAHMPDPTLLLDKNDYLQLAGAERLRHKVGGVYTYFLDNTKKKQAIAEQVSQHLGEPVYSCQASCGLDEKVRGVVDDFIMPSVEDWLSGFANAQFVLTDSFHGMIFSIIFNKPFFVIRNVDRGQARIESLSRSFRCEDRLLGRDAALEYLSKISESSFGSFNILLEAASKLGICFLESSLDDSNKVPWFAM